MEQKEILMMASVFQKEFIISSYELNPLGQARLTTIANYFQEVAYHHARQLGFGYEQMKERRTLWMLSRMKIHMFRFPAWNEKVVVETWPSGIEKLFALRDFRICDANDRPLGIATTCWLIVNLDTHRPIRPGRELERFSNIKYGAPVFDSNLEKINLPGELVALSEHRVVFSDLDIVGHVNNVKYLEWCIDALTSGAMTGRIMGGIEINFLHEAVQGNHVLLSGGEYEQGPGYTLVAKRQEDGQELIRARIFWA